MEVLLAHKADINFKDTVSRREECEGVPFGQGGLGLGVGVWGQGSGMAYGNEFGVRTGA